MKRSTSINCSKSMQRKVTCQRNIRNKHCRCTKLTVGNAASHVHKMPLVYYRCTYAPGCQHPRNCTPHKSGTFAWRHAFIQTRLLVIDVIALAICGQLSNDCRSVALRAHLLAHIIIHCSDSLGPHAKSPRLETYKVSYHAHVHYEQA